MRRIASRAFNLQIAMNTVDKKINAGPHANTGRQILTIHCLCVFLQCDDVAVPPRLLWSMHYHERVFEADDETPSAAADVPQGLGVAFEGSMLFHIAAAQSAEEEAQREAQVGCTDSCRRDDTPLIVDDGVNP